jgi:hypothetical protein
MTSEVRLAHVGIDFVGDPVVGEKNGEESANEPENPAAGKPGGAEIGIQESDVNEVGRGITEIGEEGENGHGKKSGEMERWTKVRPRSDNPYDADAEQDEVVKNAAGFPEAGGGGEEFAEIAVVMVGKGLRGHEEPPR